MAATPADAHSTHSHTHTHSKRSSCFLLSAPAICCHRRSTHNTAHTHIEQTQVSLRSWMPYIHDTFMFAISWHNTTNQWRCYCLKPPTLMMMMWLLRTPTHCIRDQRRACAVHWESTKIYVLRPCSLCRRCLCTHRLNYIVTTHTHLSESCLAPEASSSRRTIYPRMCGQYFLAWMMM